MNLEDKQAFQEKDEAFFRDYISVKDMMKDEKVHAAVKESLIKIKERKGKLIPVKEAITGSDLLGNLLVIQNELDAAPPYAIEDPMFDITQICGLKTVGNFNEIKLFQTTEVEDFLEVKPTEDYKGTYFIDAYDSIAIKKFGRIFSVSWESLMNDTIGEFAELQNKLRRAAMRTIFSQIVGQFAGNLTFFAAACLNVGTGVLNQPNLQIGMTAMMSQTDANGNIMNLKTVYLVVPSALAFTAEQLVNPMIAALAAPTMVTAPIKFNLKVIVCPWLDAYSVTGWYLFADPNVLPAITRLQLGGHTGVELFMRISDQRAIAGAITGELGSFRGDVIDFKGRILHNSTTRYCQAGYYSDGTV